MSDVRVHIRRLVVDAGYEDLDARTLPDAIEAALSARLDPRAVQQAPPVPSAGGAIAEAIATHVMPATRRTGGGRG